MGAFERAGHKGLNSPVANLAILFVLAGVAIFVSAFASYRFFANELVSSEHDKLLGIARIKAERLGAIIAERRNDARVFAARPTIWKTLGGIDLEMEAPRVAKAIADTKQGYGYRHIFVVDTAFQMVAPAIADLPLDSVELSALREAVRTREAVLADLHWDEDGEIAYGFAQPVFAHGDADEAVVGGVFLERDGGKDIFPLLESHLSSSPSKETVLTRREGDFVVFLSRLRFKPEVQPMTFRQPVGYQTLSERGLVRREFGVLEGHDYRGVDVIGATHPVAGTPWMMVSKIDRDEIEVPAKVLGVIIIVLTFILMLFLWVIFHLTWSRRILAVKAERAAVVERHMVALRTSIDGYMVVEQSGRIIEVNTALGRMTGYDEAELTCLHIQDVEASESPAEVAEHITYTMRSGYDRFSSRWRRKDGGVFNVDISVSFVDGLLFAFVQDVTERKRSEEALRESEARFRQMFESNAAVLLLIDPVSGAIVEANAAAERFYGYSAGQLIAMRIDHINALPPEKVIAERARAAQHECSFFVSPHKLANGDMRTVEVRSSPINVGGRVLLFSIIHDITERKKAEALVLEAHQRLAEQARQLEATNAELMQFTSVASHDLRAPLRLVTSYLGLITRKLGPDIDDEMREFIGFAVGAAKRMDALIVGLLDYSRTGRGGEPLEDVALAEIVGEGVHNLSVVINESGAEVSVAEGLPVITGYRGELVRLFQNLIDNAVKYRTADRVPKVSVGWRKEGSEWVVWVRDNGIGIDPASFDRAFGAFQRLVTYEENAYPPSSGSSIYGSQ